VAAAPAVRFSRETVSPGQSDAHVAARDGFSEFFVLIHAPQHFPSE